MSASVINLSTSYDISLQPFCKEHVKQLSENLRQRDWAEMWACYQLSAEKAIRYCVSQSISVWTLLYQGKVCAVAGIEPLNGLGSSACVWSWTTTDIVHCQKSFWRVSKWLVKEFRTLYPYLYAACAEDYLTARKYLERLGAVSSGKNFYLADPKTKFILYQWI